MNLNSTVLYFPYCEYRDSAYSYCSCLVCFNLMEIKTISIIKTLALLTLKYWLGNGARKRLDYTLLEKTIKVRPFKIHADFN